MKIGFVGVGRWAQKLATAFRECGAEIVAYDRKLRPDGFCNFCKGKMRTYIGAECPACHKSSVAMGRTDFGEFKTWEAQLLDPSIDAIIAVATPEVTTEVALACAAAGKPVMATKPLFDHPETIRAPFYADFWRLWSLDYQAARDVFRRAVMRDDQDDSRRFSINLFGSGPFRDFPGAFDYGPHVVAMFMDLIGPDGMALNKATRLSSVDGETFDVEWVGHGDRLHFRACFGNGSPSASRSFGHPEHQVYEESSHIGSEEKSVVLRRFCQSFLDDISEGFVDTRLLNLSRDGMRELRRIREMAVGK